MYDLNIFNKRPKTMMKQIPILLIQRVDAKRIKDLKFKEVWERNLVVAVSKDLIPKTMVSEIFAFLLLHWLDILF